MKIDVISFGGMDRSPVAGIAELSSHASLFQEPARDAGDQRDGKPGFQDPVEQGEH